MQCFPSNRLYAAPLRADIGVPVWLAARQSAGAVGRGPQADRAIADGRVGAADPLRNSPQAVLVFAAVGDSVLPVLLGSFTHQPIFGWRP